jgi:raffinose/stachyose/melibiose transport system permease protein
MLKNHTGVRRRGLKEVPWLIAVPALGLLVAFHFAPVAFGSYYAFTSWNGLSHPRWVGLENFREILSDPSSSNALRNTLELAFCFAIAVNVVGLALALALDRAVKTRNFLRLVFFIPVVLSSLATGFIWRWIFDYNGGLNWALGAVGLGSDKQVWLGDRSLALWIILVVLVWQSVGISLVLYLAGLQAIPDDVYEASLVDGASGWFRFRKVVLPLLAPAMTISVTLSVIHGLRAFDTLIAVGGLQTLALQVYEQTFLDGRYGYGTATALVLTALVTVCVLTQLALLRRNEARL